MQNTFTNIDGYKVTWLLQEGLEKLRFLQCINKEDDTSSELAGYEIKKLLTEQNHLEETYAHLLKVRGTLKGISNKRRLEETQKEVEEVAHALKESTKKLGRLFRENPDLKKEAEKVNNERIMLLGFVGTVTGHLQLQNPNLPNCQVELIKELEEQDSLRQQILKEKALLADIKSLHAQFKAEELAYQNEQSEKQANLQTRKETLEKARSDAEVEKKNKREEVQADLGTKARLQDQRIADLEKQIEKLKEKKAVETQVFAKVSAFLREKEAQKKEESTKWSKKVEDTQAAKQEQIDKLTELRERKKEELEKLRKEYEERNDNRMNKEQKQIEREEAKRRRIEEEERLDEAIKKIQEYYKAWKDGGGVLKKKKKGKKGGKKKK